MSKNERTIKKYNLDILSGVGFGNFEMPELKGENTTPTQLVGFNFAITTKKYDSFIHFYLDDYQFERVWNCPQKYVELFKKFEGIFTPDFSLYKDMPLPVQIYNTYRSRLLGKYYQDLGIKVIPTVSWSDERSFDFCFEGIPKGDTVSVSTVGVLNDNSSKNLFESGFKKMKEVLQPNKILIYGKEIDVGVGNFIYFKNENIERVKNYGR